MQYGNATWGINKGIRQDVASPPMLHLRAGATGLWVESLVFPFFFLKKKIYKKVETRDYWILGTRDWVCNIGGEGEDCLLPLSIPHIGCP
jgi:hypothetical protein